MCVWNLMKQITMIKYTISRSYWMEIVKVCKSHKFVEKNAMTACYNLKYVLQMCSLALKYVLWEKKTVERERIFEIWTNVLREKEWHSHSAVCWPRKIIHFFCFRFVCVLKWFLGCFCHWHSSRYILKKGSVDIRKKNYLK